MKERPPMSRASSALIFILFLRLPSLHPSGFILHPYSYTTCRYSTRCGWRLRGEGGRGGSARRGFLLFRGWGSRSRLAERGQPGRGTACRNRRYRVESCARDNSRR